MTELKEKAYIPASKTYGLWEGPIADVCVTPRGDSAFCCKCEIFGECFNLTVKTGKFEVRTYSRCKGCSGNIFELLVRYGHVW